MGGPLRCLGPLLPLLFAATAAPAQTGIPAALDAAIEICAGLTEADDRPPAEWYFQDSHPIPPIQGTAPGRVREWTHPSLDMSIHAAHWPETGLRTCTLGPEAPAFEPRSLDGRANVPIEGVRAALERWRMAAGPGLRARAGFGWVDGEDLHCQGGSGLSLSHATSDRHLARYQFWMIHQAAGPDLSEDCDQP